MNVYDLILDHRGYVSEQKQFQAIINKNVVFVGYVFSTCANTGRYGPTQHQCDLVYQGERDLQVKVIEDSRTLPAGTQLWSVPVDGFYT